METLLDPILASNERVLWQGRPHFLQYIATSLPIVIFAIIWLGFISIFTVVFTATGTGSATINDVSYRQRDGGYYIDSQKVSEQTFTREYAAAMAPLKYILIPFWVVGVFMALSPIVSVVRYFKTSYAITDTRVITTSGIIGTDYRFIDFHSIKNTSVIVGLIDKLFNTGSIFMFTGEYAFSNNGGHSVTDRLVGISNPYEVVKILQEQIQNIHATK